MPSSRSSIAHRLTQDANRVCAAATPDLAESYEAECDSIWRSLRRLGVRESELEDAVHDVFVIAHRRLGELAPRAPLRPWLFGVALRVAANLRRKHARTEPTAGPLESIDQGPGPDELVAAREAHGIVLRALGTLDEAQREVLVLHDLEGLSAPDIAAATGTSLNTVYSRLRLARPKFVKAVETLRSTGAPAGRRHP